jgi:Rps23 Pro-64 3,4-dihydroxylase Tpa1-like proline 4-hydroxylase
VDKTREEIIAEYKAEQARKRLENLQERKRKQEQIREAERLKIEQREKEQYVKLIGRTKPFIGKIVTVEGEVNEYSSGDYYCPHDNNYIEEVVDYLDTLPLGCTVRVTMEVIGPKE